MTWFILVYGRVERAALAVVPEFGIWARVARLAIVGIDDVAGRAARLTVVAGLIVGSHEPGQRIVEPGLGEIEHRD